MRYYVPEIGVMSSLLLGSSFAALRFTHAHHVHIVFYCYSIFLWLSPHIFFLPLTMKQDICTRRQKAALGCCITEAPIF